jgi:hypothetical protein
VKVTHWTIGSRSRWLQTRRRLEYWTGCSRWLPLSMTGEPAAVTCKQCLRYLDRSGAQPVGEDTGGRLTSARADGQS